MKKIVVTPIAFVKNERDRISDDFWGGVLSEISLADELPADSLDRIEEFSHLEIIYLFHKVDPGKTVYSGHPRENLRWPKSGIFAQRKKDRPNRLGTAIVRLVKREGRKIVVENLDAINGTPVLDIKPVFIDFLPGEEVKQPAWSKEIMKNYWRKK